MLSLLLRQPLVKFWSIVHIENVVVASEKDGQLRMAARRFDGVNQFFHLFQRSELIVRPMEQPERNSRQFSSPRRDRTDRSERYNRGEPIRPGIL